MTVAFFYEFEPPKWEVEADITERETHEGTAEVTEHAIETGSNPSDHIRPKPDTLSIDIGVTDTPLVVPSTQTDGVRYVEKTIFRYQTVRINNDGKLINGPVVTHTGRVLSDKLDRVRRVHEAFRQRRKSGKLVNVSTGLQEYESMAITRVGAVYESEGRITFSVDLKEVTFDTLKLVAALKPKPKAANGKKKTARGNVAPIPIPEEEEEDAGQTLLSSVLSSEPPTMSAVGG